MELRDVLASQSDLQIVWVMAANQINERTRAFVNETGSRDRVRFVADPGSQMIDRLGIRKPDAEEIEHGVPHPTTLLVDSSGTVRYVDVREDFHVWLDPRALGAPLAELR